MAIDPLATADGLVVVNQDRLLLWSRQNNSFIWTPAALAQWVMAQWGIGAQWVVQHRYPLATHAVHGSAQVIVVAVTEGDAWVSLRAHLGLVSDYEYFLASKALQLMTWHRQHQFCGQCGRPTTAHAVDGAFYCDPCQLSFYPRLAPCMMCLVVRGDECLLAHHHRHPSGFYSTLAGFVEAGETLEQTVHREVMEEVGLTVGNLSYFASQSWPFPQQLMVGYFADYVSGCLTVDGDEIVEACWFHYQQLPHVPSAETLSGQLIQQFVERCLAD